MKSRSQSWVQILLALILAPLLVLTGCSGGTEDAADELSDSQIAAEIDKESNLDDVGNLAAECPAEATKKFAKTKFALHSGLAIGALQRWIIKPARNGGFKKGADGRFKAFVKAGAAALFVKYEFGKAYENAKADPTLCKSVAGPMSKISNQLKGAIASAKKGDLAAVTSLGGLADQIMNMSKQKGIDIVPDENANITGR